MYHEFLDSKTRYRNPLASTVARNLTGNSIMKLTQEVIDQIQEAMLHTKMNGDVNWQDGDEIDVCLGGTFAGDKFISIINRTRSNTTKR